MAPEQLKQGRAYYRITYADPQLTIPGVEPMIYVGVDISDEKDPEHRYYFQDTVSFMQHGSCVDYAGPKFAEDDTPFNVYSFSARELGSSLVELPEAIRLLTEANERAGKS